MIEFDRPKKIDSSRFIQTRGGIISWRNCEPRWTNERFWQILLGKASLAPCLNHSFRFLCLLLVRQIIGMPRHNYKTISTDEDTRSTHSTKSGSSLGSLFPFGRGRRKRHSTNDAQRSRTASPSFRDPDGSASISGTQKAATVEETTEKRFDLDSLIAMCKLKLELPDTAGDATFEAKPSLKGIDKTIIPSKVFAMAKKSVTRAMVQPTMLLIPHGNVDELPQEDRPRHRCGHLAATICRLCAYPFGLVWGRLHFRVALVPGLLVISWITACHCLSLNLMLMNLLLPSVALVLAILAVVLQCWIVSWPIAQGMATLVSQLQPMIDSAFGQMVDQVPRRIAQILQRLGIPATAADNLCRTLCMPLREVLSTIYKILPRINNASAMTGCNERPLQPLAVFVFAGLVLGLRFY